MHIVLVTSTYPPDNGWGGIGSYVYHMSRGLTRVGHRVTVVCGFGKEPRESSEDNIRVLRVIDTRPGAPAAAPVQVRAVLEGLVKAESVDVIEVPENGALGLEFQRANPHVAVVVKLHGDTEFCLYGNSPAWKRIAYRFYRREGVRVSTTRERESTGRASAVVAPSEWLLADCRRRGWPIGSRGTVVVNPFSGWPAGVEPQAASRDPRKVLWLARLDLLKGADLLPAIARAVWSRVPGAEFHVIGQQQLRRGQPWMDWIKARVPQRDRGKIVYLGGLPYLEVAERLPEFSVAVFASTRESFGYTELECMWAGIACVSASGGGAAELGTNGQTHIRAARRPSAIAREVVGLMNNSLPRERIGSGARAHALGRYNAATVGMQMTAVYSTACQRAANRKGLT